MGYLLYVLKNALPRPIVGVRFSSSWSSINYNAPFFDLFFMGDTFFASSLHCDFCESIRNALISLLEHNPVKKTMRPLEIHSPFSTLHSQFLKIPACLLAQRSV